MRHPLGHENLHTLEDVAGRCWTCGLATGHAAGDRQAQRGRVGAGNAFVDLAGVARPAGADERVEVDATDADDAAGAPDVPLEAYVAKLAERGGIVEERVTGDEVRSPSVQLRVLARRRRRAALDPRPAAGGPGGQSYLGCEFPADFAYSRLIGRAGERSAQRLAGEGVLGRFAIDFVVVRDAEGAWTSYAIEINLRKGGTTHPFLTLQFLTDGRYDADSGLFLTPAGAREAPGGHRPSGVRRSARADGDDLFDIVARHGLHFDQSRQTGVVFHMISSLTERGRVGLTAVGESPADADRRHRQAEKILLQEAAVADGRRADPRCDREVSGAGRRRRTAAAAGSARRLDDRLGRASSASMSSRAAWTNRPCSGSRSPRANRSTSAVIGSTGFHDCSSGGPASSRSCRCGPGPGSSRAR